jgi:hypothetical protein
MQLGIKHQQIMLLIYLILIMVPGGAGVGAASEQNNAEQGDAPHPVHPQHGLDGAPLA